MWIHNTWKTVCQGSRKHTVMPQLLATNETTAAIFDSKSLEDAFTTPAYQSLQDFLLPSHHHFTTLVNLHANVVEFYSGINTTWWPCVRSTGSFPLANRSSPYFASVWCARRFVVSNVPFRTPLPLYNPELAFQIHSPSLVWTLRVLCTEPAKMVQLYTLILMASLFQAKMKSIFIKSKQWTKVLVCFSGLLGLL